MTWITFWLWTGIAVVLIWASLPAAEDRRQTELRRWNRAQKLRRRDRWTGADVLLLALVVAIVALVSFTLGLDLRGRP